MSVGRAMALAVNGCIAFGLNIVSFTANKHVGPLGMTVAGESSFANERCLVDFSFSEYKASTHHVTGCRYFRSLD